MNTWLLTIVGLIYIWVGIDYWGQGRWPMTLVMVAYALANVGLILDALRGGT